jgi:hypothetical protein
LEFFTLTDGQIEFLNIANGNNNLLTDFDVTNNPNLYCIQVDDENAANNSLGVYSSWQTDAQIQYSY